MGTIRVRTLAQELGLEKEVILEAAKIAGVPALSHASILTDDQVDDIRDVLFPEEAEREKRANRARAELRFEKEWAAKQEAEEFSSKVESYLDTSALDDMVVTIGYQLVAFDFEANEEYYPGDEKTESYKGADSINKAFSDYYKAFHWSGDGSFWEPVKTVISWRGKEVETTDITAYNEEMFSAWLTRAIWEHGGDFYRDTNACAYVEKLIKECYKRQLDEAKSRIEK